jgi:hypothetical protein
VDVEDGDRLISFGRELALEKIKSAGANLPCERVRMFTARYDSDAPDEVVPRLTQVE